MVLRVYSTPDGYEYYADDGTPTPADTGGTEPREVQSLAPAGDDAFADAAARLMRGVRSPARAAAAEGRNLLDPIFGTGGQERFQTWPERLLRSAATAPRDAYRGELPDTEAVMEPNALAKLFGADKRWSVPAPESMIGRAQDVSAAAVTGPLTMKPGTATLGSGATRAGIGDAAMSGYRPEQVGNQWWAKASEGPGRIGPFGSEGEVGTWIKENTSAKTAVAPVFYSAVEHAINNAQMMKAPTKAEATAHAKEAIAATGSSWDRFTPEQQQEWLQRSHDQIVGQRDKKQSASPEQWIGYIRNQPGVKTEELQWMGLEDWLREQKGPVTKAQIDDYVKSHKVDIKEVNKTGPSADDVVTDDRHDAGVDYLRREWERRTPDAATMSRRQRERSFEEFGESDEGAALFEDFLHDQQERGGQATKYSEYQLPGGDNYREMLLTLPPKKKFKPLSSKERAEFNKLDRQELRGPEFTPEQAARYETLSERVWSQDRPETEGNYISSHWDEPNVLAHVRVNDRFIPNPNGPSSQVLPKDFAINAGDVVGPPTRGGKTLFLEEVQSDWHQAGRKGGYKADISRKQIHAARDKAAETQERLHQAVEEANKNDRLGLIPAEMNQIVIDLVGGARYTADRYMAGSGKYQSPEFQQLAKEAFEAKQEHSRLFDATTNKVPDAPFKQTWPDLVLKRMIREAAEKGYDQIAWTPGEVQAARYDLSKAVDSIQTRSEGNNRHVTVNAKSGVHATALVDKDGKIVQGYDAFRDAAGRPLSDYVGKEVADKILKGEGTHKPIDASGWYALKDQTGDEWHVLDNRGVFINDRPVSAPSAEAAVKMVEKESKDQGIRTLEGLDLKVGGEGMKSFYDKMLVDKANALAKKHGSKVEKQKMPGMGSEYKSTPDGTYYPTDASGVRTEGDLFKLNKDPNGHYSLHLVDDAGKELNWFGYHKTEAEAIKEMTKRLPKGADEVWVLPITPKMKEAALGKGFPLFSSGLPYQFHPVDHDPFQGQYKLEPVDHDPFAIWNPNRT